MQACEQVFGHRDAVTRVTYLSLLQRNSTWQLGEAPATLLEKKKKENLRE